MRKIRTSARVQKRIGKKSVNEESAMQNYHRWLALRSLERKPSLLVLTFVFACALCAGRNLRAQSQPAANTTVTAADQQTFATPEAASQALSTAAEAKDRDALRKIFGPDYDQLLSGDPVEDEKDLSNFAKGLQESTQLRKDYDTKYTLLVGKNNWPTPIPIVKRGNDWLFDTKAGLEEVLNRRIGDNELSAIAICRTYAVAQWEYFTEGDHDDGGVAEYAQKFMSSPGRQDGLYWPTAPDEKPSPFGELVAEARAEGYGHKPGTQPAKPAGSAAQPGETSAQPPRHPYHGYFFKILTRQGSSAPAGRYDYIINGHMLAGFALVAYPEKWGNSGIMTFIINQEGRVYQKNLGPDTDKIAAAMTEYNPDPTWQLVPQ